MITDNERDFFHRLAARARQHRLDLIHHGWANVPTYPALDRLFRAVARELSQDDLETFCAIPALLDSGTPATPIEIPL